MYASTLFAALSLASCGFNSASALFDPQPPFGRQAVQGPNPENITQTYFFAAQSNSLTNGVPDSLQFSFQIGSFFGPALAPSDYFIVVSGTKAGIPFAKTLVAPNDTIAVTDYSGNWGVGNYRGTLGWSSITSTVNSTSQNVTGSINLNRSDAPPAWACGPAKGTNLESLIRPSSSAAEIDTYKNTNFAHFASGQATVQLTIDGARLEFTGPYEAETSYGKPYQVIYSRFIYGFTTVGPYSFVFWHVAPVGEPTNFATIGYLSKHHHLIVNRCNTVNSSAAQGTVISPSGLFNVTGVPTPVPGKLLVEFFGKHGKHYKFTVKTIQAAGGVLPAGTSVSSLATVKGGKVGGRQYEGNAFTLYFAGPGNVFL